MMRAVAAGDEMNRWRRLVTSGDMCWMAKL